MKRFLTSLFAAGKGNGEAKISRNEAVPQEIIAAIGIAIAKYEQGGSLDTEPMRLTILRTTQPYSPWGAKIHGIANQINRK